MKNVLRLCLPLLAALLVFQSSAQVPPSSSEIASYSGLHLAAQQGNVAAIERILISSRSQLDSRDSYGRTPLHVATHARQRGAVQVLLKNGANHALLENDRYDAVTIASVADDEETLRLLLSAGASAKLVTSRYDGTALIASAHLGHDGVVRQLIAAGAPLDHVNNLHWTAMIESIVLGNGGERHQRCLQALLSAGANTQLTDRDGRTPLQLAKGRGFEAMTRALLAAGAR